MKQMYMLNNSKDVIRTLVGLKSRITTFHSRFTLVALSLCTLLMLGGFSARAWGATATFNATNSSFSGSAPYTITQDSVTFSLNVPNWYNGGSGHFYIYTSNTTATIGWTPATGFTIAVTGVSLNGQNAQEKHWFSQRVGLSYIRSHTASDNTEVKISQNNTTNTYPFTTSNTNLFPGGSALGNSAYFKLRAEKGYSDADHDNSYEYQINWATITYTVTPPAPTLKNGSSVTRSQFVEGRSNNTVTLTDYFKPFNSGVSMSYVVKKKNGSGVYETINSGYTITDNVFKTTVVGEYQIFANSNATGAFNASSSSSALTVTIEEVRPVTISVGSQELYVGSTTSMTITEQLNTTQPVNFEYDTNFFEYNTSTHVLTAKNTGNANFNTIEKSIRVTQATDGEFAAVDMTINFTIKKNVPTFTWNTREHYYYNETISHFFKSSNTATAISVTSTDAHKQIATVVDSALVIYNKPGTARVTMTQAENYYWAEHTEYRDVTPEKVSNHVEFTYTKAMFGEGSTTNSITITKNSNKGMSWDDSKNAVCLGNGERNVFDLASSDYGDKYIDIAFYGIPDTLKFDYAVNQGVATFTGDYNWAVYEKAPGGEWSSRIWDSNRNNETFETNVKVPLKETTRYVRLLYTANFSGFYKNIKVTEKKYFKTDSTSFDFKTQIKNADVPSKSFKFKHANAGYTVTAASNDSHYKVSLNNSDFYSSIIIPNTGGDRMDSSVVYVKYYPSIAGDVEETHNATITFSDALSNSATVSLTGKTQAKLATYLEYIGSDSYSVNADNIAATSLFQVVDANGAVVASPVITLSSNNTSAINTVSENRAISFLCGADDVRITASYTGDETYAAASNSGTFYHDIDVTKPNDVITWSHVAEDGKIHVWADSNMPSPVASANTTISNFVSGNSDRLSVSGSAGSFTLHAGQHGEVTLTATSAGDCSHNGVSDTKTIVVDPCTHNIVWNQKFMGLMADEGGHIDSTIVLNAYAVDSMGNATGKAVTYSLEGAHAAEVATLEGCTLRIIGAGETILRVTTAADNKYAIASDTRKIVVRTYGQDCGTNLVDDPYEHHVSFYTNNPGKVYEWTAPADSIFVRVGKESWATTQSLHIYTYDKDGNETNWQDWGVGSLSSDGDDKRLELPEGTVKIKFQAIGTQYKWYSNLIVTQKSYFTASTSSVTMSTVTGCETATGEFTLSYSDVPYVLLSQTNEDFTYEVWRDGKKLEGFDNTCGDWGVYTIKFFYTPKVGGAYSNTVTLSTVNKTPQVITLSGTANKPDREIVWDIETGNTITATQSLDLTAYARTTCEDPAGSVYYTASPAAAVTIEGNHITFDKAATVTVTAHTVASDDYNDALTVDKVWAVGKVGTQMRRLPKITSTITYGDNSSVVTYDNDSWCGEDVLSHDSVPGTIAYVGPDNFTAAGPTNLSFNFTPSDLSVYDAQPFTVQVTVQKATTTASANAIVLTYGETPDSKALSTASAALEGTWSWNDDRSDDVLNASAEAYVLNVIFTPNNTNYFPYETTVNVTVNKANPVATVENVSFVYGTKAEDVALVGTGAGTWSWTDSRKGQVLAVGEYEMDVHFAPTDATNYNEKDATVTLTVNKIEALQVPVALSFCAGGSETYRGTTYTEAGTYPVNAVGATRDTVYNVTVTVLQPTTGTDSKTITAGDNESWNGIDLSGYAAGSHSVEVVLTNAAGCDSTVTLTLTVNALIINQFTNTSGDGDWDNNANWSSGSKPAEADPDVIVSGDLVIDSEVTVGSLTIETGNRVVLTVNGDLTINGTSEVRAEYGSLYVENGGEVEVNGNLKVGDLTVEASIGTSNGSAASGQVDKAENIVYANAYIEINMDPSGTLDDTKFYGFTVPFDVDVHNGISRKENGVYRQCAYGTHYMIAEYDANKRLNSGKGWKYISGNTLQAGTFYYLTVDGNYNTYRFKAKDATYTQAAPSTLVMNGATSNPNANWNAVGNSTLQHAKASFEGGNYVQVYENGLDAYRTVSVTEATFVVGCPFFIQAKEASTLVLDVPTSSTELYYAPRRSKAAQEGVSRVNLISVEGGYSDQIYVCGSDKEENAYITGRDLAKAGESKVVPQLWVNTYNQKLSVHEAAWQGENAVCPLGIYVPKNGEYTLTATQAEDGTQVYLTIDGMPVWNISETEYVLSLNKGTMSNFGLMLVKAPKIATGVENVEANEGENAQKMILNDQMYILRNGKMYDAAGRKVK